MYLHLGQETVVATEDIIGIFDLDNASYGLRTRQFLERAEREGRVVTVSEELPKSFVLCAAKEAAPVVYVSQLNSQTLGKRPVIGQ